MKREQDQQQTASKKEILIQNLCYLTRALVKNNIVKQNMYMVLLAIEYLMMLYYTTRLADVQTFTEVFSSLELMLDIGKNEHDQIIKADSSSNITNSAQNKASIHVYINCIFLGIYLTAIIIFASQIFKINSFDKTKESSYLLKGLSLFLVLTQTVLQVPVIVSVISLLTDRDIFSTLAYLFIFIPVMVKIIFSADQHRKHQVIYKMKSEDGMSKNEYLIALTHLLKMIKRQSETDLAQLMSFTYQHKLSCYNNGCICQFFTQYCQDPQLFKKKKKQIYRGFRDDGFKLIQIQQGDGGIIDFLEEQVNLNGDEENSMHAGTRENAESQVFESTFNQLVGSDATLVTSNVLDEQRNTVMDLHNSNYINRDGNQDPNFANNHQLDSEEKGNQNSEIVEPNIMCMLNKGYILRGSAYSGFDTNMDFKIKGEFKRTMFKQLEKKTDGNLSFSLISIYYQYAYQHNIYQAVLAIVKSARNVKQSFLQRMQFSITEFYLLELILQEFKITSSKEEVNYSNFIESNQMQQNLDWLFEEAAGDIMQFWKILKEEQANVQRAYVLGLSISKKISQIKNYTKILEESQLIKDYNKYYYYAMFYQNILNDKQNYNLMINNLKNLLMIRNMRKKNSRFGNITDINDIGFAILSFEDDKTVGKFKYANRVICQILNTSEESILEQSAKCLMPELICANHHLFIRRFIAEGNPRFIGRVRTIFIKDFLNYIKPVQFYINFHYNSKFSYSIIMHIDPILSLNFQNNQMIPIKDTFIINADQHNNVKNISANCKKLIGLSKKQQRMQEELLGRTLRMEDLINQMGKFDQFIYENPNCFLTNQIVKVRTFNNSSEQNYVTCSLQYEEVVYLENTPSEFREKVCIFIPVSKIPEYDSTSMISQQYQLQSSQIQSSNMVSQNDANLGFLASSDLTQSIDFPQILGDEKFGSMSHSASSRSSSTVTTSSSLSYTKGMLFQQRSPKILRIYLYIVFGVLFSFIAVSSINFIIYIQKKNLVNLQIKFNNLINQRNTCLTSTLSSLKQMHLIAGSPNGTLLNTSAIFTDITRYEYYMKKVAVNSQSLLDLHEEFKSLSLRNEEIGRNQNPELFNKVALQYLSKNFQVYQQSNSLDYGLSLLVSNIGMITSSELLNLRIPINIDNVVLKGQKDKNQTASDLLRNLYYVFNNGMSQLNFLGTIQEQNIQDNTMKTSDQSKLYINLMSFISIGIITLIGVFTFPLLGKIEERKISVLKFFNLLNLNQIQIQIDRGREFQDEFNMLSKDANQSKRNEENNDDDDYYDEYDSEEEQLAISQQVQADSKKSAAYNSAAKKSDQKYQINSDIIDVIDVNIKPEFQNKSTNPIMKNNRNELKTIDPEVIIDGVDDEDIEEVKDHLAETNDKLRVKFATQDSYLKNSKNQKFLNPNGFQANKRPQVTRKKSPKRRRKDSDLKHTSMFDIQRIFDRIHMNEEKQVKLQDERRNKIINANKEANIQNPDFDDVKEKSKFSKLQDVFQNPGSTIGGPRRNIMQRVDEEIKEEGDGQKAEKSKVNKMQRRNKKGSRQNVNSAVKFMPKEDLGKTKKQGPAGDFNTLKSQRPVKMMNEIMEDDSESKHSKKSDQNDRKRKYKMKDFISFKANTNRSDQISDSLEKIALKEKLKLALYVLIVLVFLNSNLIASYYIGQKTFSEDSQAIMDLAIFYHKENYLDNLLFYTQEEFVQNKSIIINGTDIAAHYLDQSQLNEFKYNDLRKGYPIFLDQIKDRLERLESTEICSIIYSSNPPKQITCENAYDSIMKRGLTSTLYMIFNYAQTLQVRFAKENRTESFLRERILDTRLRDMTDLFNEYLHDALDYMEDLATQTTTEYFDGLSSSYMIIYASYIGISIVLCFFFGFFVFRKLREQIMTSTNILAIIPLEDLDNRDRIKIETFLNQ
eukprot:403356890